MKHIALSGCIFFSFLFMGASCTIRPSDGAVFKSDDSGSQWRSVSLMTSGKKKVKLSSIDVTRIVVDSRNSSLIYLGTLAHGLFVSDSGGENWTQLIGKEAIIDIIPDPTARCTLYVITPTRLLKTQNCAEKWDVLYNESRSEIFLSSAAVDQYNPNSVYLTTSGGDVYRSADGGVTWTTSYRVDPMQAITRIIIDPFDSALVFFATDASATYRSANRGDTWALTGQQISWIERDGGVPGYVALSSLSHKNGLMYASRDAIFTSKDGGQTWSRVPLLTSKEKTKILDAAINPTNDNQIYYVVENTLYFSNDAGAHWRVSPLPGSRPPSALVLDPNNSSTVYVGERTYQKNAGWPYNKYIR